MHSLANRYCGYLLTLLAVSTPGLLRAQGEAGISLEKIVKAWQDREGRIKTFRFSWVKEHVRSRGSFLSPEWGRGKNPDLKTVPEETTSYEEFYSAINDGGKIRFTRSRMEGSVDHILRRQETTSVANGKDCRVFRARGAVEYPLGEIGQEKVNPMDLTDPEFFPLLMILRPFHPVLGSFNGQSTVRNMTLESRIVTVAKRPCYQLKLVDPSSSVVQFFWVDSERDFTLVRRSLTQEGKLLAQIDWEDYKLNGRIWIPHRWKMVWMRDDRSVLSSGTSIVKEFSINSAVDEKEFELEFPVGTLVRERGSHPVDYILREGGNKRLVTLEEWGATYEQLLASESGQGLKSSSSRRRVVLLVGALGGIVLITVLIAWRVRRTRPRVDQA